MKWISKVALIGKPAVGKSQLALLLAGKQGLAGQKHHKPSFCFYPRRFRVLPPGFAKPYVVTDLPGLSLATLPFLRQAERAKALLFVLSLEDKDTFATYKYLEALLGRYDKEQGSHLLAHPRLFLLKGENNKNTTIEDKAFRGLKRVSFFSATSERDVKRLFSLLNDG